MPCFSGLHCATSRKFVLLHATLCCTGLTFLTIASVHISHVAKFYLSLLFYALNLSEITQRSLFLLMSRNTLRQATPNSTISHDSRSYSGESSIWSLSCPIFNETESTSNKHVLGTVLAHWCCSLAIWSDIISNCRSEMSTWSDSCDILTLAWVKLEKSGSCVACSQIGPPDSCPLDSWAPHSRAQHSWA